MARREEGEQGKQGGRQERMRGEEEARENPEEQKRKIPAKTSPSTLRDDVLYTSVI